VGALMALLVVLFVQQVKLELTRFCGHPEA
jgi:hypothetical protein